MSEIQVMPRGMAVRQIVGLEYQAAQNLWVKPAHEYRVRAPPASPIFVEEKYNIERFDIKYADEVLKTHTTTIVSAKLTPQAKRILSYIESAGFNPADLYRGGTIHVPVPNKKLTRHVKNMEALIGPAVQVFRGEALKAIVSKFNYLLQQYRRMSLDNLDKVEADPALLLVGKEPGTGTGYERIPALYTRELFGKNISRYKEAVAKVVMESYDGLLAMFMPDEPHWPDIGGIIPLDPIFRHIMKGSRDDPDCQKWMSSGGMEYVTVDGGARITKTGPSSVLHGPALTPTTRLMELRAQLIPECATIPTDKETFARVMSTPPITAKFISDKVVDEALLSIDFGYSDHTLSIESGRLIDSSERVKFGADNIWMTGIAYVNASDRHRITHQLASGEPWTEISYSVLLWIIQAAVNAHNLYSVKVYQIGDDWHILGKVEHLLTLAQALQSCMRTKGMRDSLVFILGRYNHFRDPDHIVSFVMPRIMKSVPSATQNTFNTPEITIQDRNVPVYITPAQAMGAKDFIARYGDTLFMEVNPTTMRSFIQNPGERGYQHIQEYLAEIGGISEYAVQVQSGSNLLEDAGSDE